MKVVEAMLLIIGILLLVLGFSGFVVGRMLPERHICLTVENQRQKVEKAVKDYEWYKGTSLENEYKRRAERYLQTQEEYTRNCNDKKSKIKFWMTVSALVAGAGLLFSVTGFFLRRRKSRALI